MSYPPPPSSGNQPSWPPGSQSPGSRPPWPGYQPWRGPQAPKPGGSMRSVLAGVAGGVVVVLIIVLIGKALRGQPASSSASARSPGSPPAATQPGSSQSAAGSAAASGASSGPVGTTFKVTGFDHSDKPATYEVTVLAVSQNAAPDNSLDGAAADHHLASAEIKITGLTGHAQDDANLDATAKGGNQQVYQPSFKGLAAGTNYSAGDFDLNPGQSVIGYVSYELPGSVQITSIAWDANLQGSGVVTWAV